MKYSSDGLVQTVNGPIQSESVGIALIHEHLHMLSGLLLPSHGYNGLEATHRRLLPFGREEELTFETIVSESIEGVESIFPGIIGEIGTSNPPTASELSVLRGAACAAIATGMSLSVHIHPWAGTVTLSPR